jgi:hypothetical protein
VLATFELMVPSFILDFVNVQVDYAPRGPVCNHVSLSLAKAWLRRSIQYALARLLFCKRRNQMACDATLLNVYCKLFPFV